MSRRRYRWNTETQQMEEIGADWSDAPSSTGDLGKFEYTNMRAIDGTPIDSRERRREYMRRHGVTDPSDFKETWAKAQAERERFRRGEQVNPELRQTLGRIEYEASKKRRK